MISVAEAQRLTLAHVAPLGTESVPVPDTLGRVLANDQHAPISLPPFANSAMDGFALYAADVAQASPSSPVHLPIAFEIPAGKAGTRTLSPGAACRIMTGAAMPLGADCVINVEDTRLVDGQVAISRPVALGDFVRKAGSDVAAGDLLLPAGSEIKPNRLALLAGVGLAEVAVYRRPRVAILATGDELVELGETLAPGEIYNSNAYAMAAMVSDFGGLPVRYGIVPDDRDRTRALIADAVSTCDLVLTSGGVSMGEFDYVSDALTALGTVHFSRVAQQPGKPLTFATIGGKPVFGLPGNPVSTMVTLEVYVRPVLRRLQGHSQLQRPQLPVRLAEPLAKSPGKQLFLRARLEAKADGLRARLTGAQASNRISSMTWANALLPIPAEKGDLPAGAWVEAMVLDSQSLVACLAEAGMMAVEV